MRSRSDWKNAVACRKTESRRPFGEVADTHSREYRNKFAGVGVSNVCILLSMTPKCDVRAIMLFRHLLLGKIVLANLNTD